MLLRRFRPRYMVLLLATTLSLCGLATVSAHAVTYNAVNYCNVVVAPYSACSDTPGYALWDQNNAEYYGSGTVSVCQKALLGDGTLATRTCADNYVNAGDALGYYYNQGIRVTPYVGNNSQWYHTILGYADYIAGGPHAPVRGSSDGPSDPATAPSVDAGTLPSSVLTALGALRTGTPSRDGSYQTLHEDGDSVFLKPTAEDVCLGSSTIGGVFTCVRHSDAAAGKLAGAVICGRNVPSDRIVAYGVVPDGVATVRAVRDHRTVQTAKVVANTYRFDMAKTAAAGVTAFAWTAADGTRGAVTGILPPDLGCAG